MSKRPKTRVLRHAMARNVPCHNLAEDGGHQREISRSQGMTPQARSPPPRRPRLSKSPFQWGCRRKFSFPRLASFSATNVYVTSASFFWFLMRTLLKMKTLLLSMSESSMIRALADRFSILLILASSNLALPWQHRIRRSRSSRPCRLRDLLADFRTLNRLHLVQLVLQF